MYRGLAAGATYYISPSGFYSNPCTQAAPCASFSRAYSVATFGDIVEMSGGNYPFQTLSPSIAKAEGRECDPQASGSVLSAGKYPQPASNYLDCITFKPQQGATVIINGISIGVPYFYLDGGGGRFGVGAKITFTAPIEIGVNDLAGCAQAHDIVVSGIQTNNSFFMYADNSAMLNSDFNLGDAFGRNVVSQFAGLCGPSRSLVRGNTFRNLLQYQKSDQIGAIPGPEQMHIECIHVRSGSDLVFDSNKFLNCAQYGMSIQADGGPLARVFVVNSVFDKICSGQPPGTYVSSGTFTSGSNVISSVSSTAGLSVGQGVYSVSLPYTNNVLSPPTVPTITALTSNTITISQNATRSASNANFFAGGSSCTGNRGLQYTGGAGFTDPLTAFNSFYDEREAYDNGPGPITEVISYANIRVASTEFFCAYGPNSNFYQVNATDWPASNPTPFNCGTGSVIGTASYLNPSTFDFRISASSAANNLVPTNVSFGIPSTDIDGNPRTGPLLDAGAYEYTTGSPPVKPGDLNNDGSVNILDLSILLSNYGKPATPSQGDINGDGNCTILDLSILLSKYGT